MSHLSLYLHIPFCLHKCGYCDFNTYALDGLLESGHVGRDWAAGYAEALMAEMEGRAGRGGLAGARVATVFFGGGTPSLFPAEETARVLDRARALFEIAPDAEITLEANPGAADAGRFAALRAAGVNRLSIGVQSFEDGGLGRLDRVHTGEEARAAFRAAREAGFDNLSLDLMFGIPFQTVEGAGQDTEDAIRLGPEHLSAYELTVEKGTTFSVRMARRELKGLPEEETALEMWRLRDRLLGEAGYARYEISNFARAGFECHHNLNYWRRGAYLGLGAGAHGFLGGRRYWNRLRPDDYMKNSSDPTAGEEEVRGEKALGEAIMLGLRLMEGVSLDALAAACGESPDVRFGPLIDQLKKDGFLARENGTLRLTERGTLVANSVLARFV